MRSIFKNAFFFGFTGTPLSKMERNTFQHFCPKEELYLDRYSMLDALNDGFTVPLSYQPRLPQYHLNKKQFDEFLRFEEEEIQPISSEEKRIKKKVRVIKAFVKKPERINEIAEDIAKHFKEVVEPTDLNAMIVTIDREAYVLYKQAIDQLLPPEMSEMVMTFGYDNQKIMRLFYELQQRYHKKDEKEIHREIIEAYKGRKGEKRRKGQETATNFDRY